MNRRLYGGDMISNARGRQASRARLSWHQAFAANGRSCAHEHSHARQVERHAWATVVGHVIEGRNVRVVADCRPVGEVHHLPIAR